MSDVEKKILKIYDGSMPVEDDLFERQWINQLAWTLVVLFAGLALWLAIALVNAENQRHALMSNKCMDPVFKTEVDLACLRVVKSRDHWWSHLWYGMTHLRSPDPGTKR